MTDNVGLARVSVVIVIDVASLGATLNFQGMWWNAPAGSESGWGINFAHQGDVIFATWFTHDANGQAWYMSMTAHQTGPNTFAGTLLRTAGPPLDAIPSTRIRCSGSRWARHADVLRRQQRHLRLHRQRHSQTKSITRQVFGPLPTCTWGGLANLALATNYTDCGGRQAESESGWGINFAHEGDAIFATWFTYDFTGAALPMSATLTKVGPGVYSGR